MKLPTIDTIVALNSVANKFHNDFVPMIVTTFLLFLKSSHYENEDRKELAQLKLILYVCYFSVVVDFLLIFISWKKGPKYWKTAAPFLYLVLIGISDLLLPLVNICLQFYFLFDKSIQMRNKNFESWAIAYQVLCFEKICSLFLTIRTTVINDAIIFYNIRKQIENLTDEEIHKMYYEPGLLEDSQAKAIRINQMMLVSEI